MYAPCGHLDEELNVSVGFSCTVTRRPKRVNSYRTWFKVILSLSMSVSRLQVSQLTVMLKVAQNRKELGA